MSSVEKEVAQNYKTHESGLGTMGATAATPVQFRSLRWFPLTQTAHAQAVESSGSDFAVVTVQSFSLNFSAVAGCSSFAHVASYTPVPLITAKVAAASAVLSGQQALAVMDHWPVPHLSLSRTQHLMTGYEQWVSL